MPGQHLHLSISAAHLAVDISDGTLAFSPFVLLLGAARAQLKELGLANRLESRPRFSAWRIRANADKWLFQG
jgi:hypothetical protein